MGEPEASWRELPEPWRIAFDEAWSSWRQGSLAVGAVVTNDDGEVVARGHNQFFHEGPGPITATYMAHAEMNALAQVPVGRGPRYSLYSTFEPCFMCSSTMLLYRIEEISFAATDPLWHGMDEWLLTAPWVMVHPAPIRTRLEGELSVLGYVLHVSRLASIAPPHVIAAHVGAARPAFEFATEPDTIRRLTTLAELGPASAEAVVRELWDDLTELAAA
jgi:tRNA(Arg) A34 adenosine deaminase TadA